MAWTYTQSTGELDHDGKVIAHGYSGHGAGVNNPDLQDQHDIGPLPAGTYTIGPAGTHGHLGEVVMALTPYPANKMFGRGSFYCHGDNSRGDRSASEGCIIMPRGIRNLLAESPDRELIVKQRPA